MRILVLAGDDSPDLATIESALRQGEIEILTTERVAGSRTSRASRWRFDGWTVDVVTRQCVGPAGRPVALTSSEYDLLTAFLRQPGRTLSRNALLRDLRGRAWTYFDRSIDTLVARLRKKVDLDPARPLIRSVRGVGYVFCASVSGAPDGDQ
ncbi:MAG TPA: winged helix-turn-helix domain-containing protein [Roseiarcus sp.]|nr:winged helix-turn-helix domain-containing protein [Roseiarcus sp.]